jgi:hypothetical protein
MSKSQDNRVVSSQLILTENRLNVQFWRSKDKNNSRPKHLSITNMVLVANLTSLVSKFGLTLYDISQEHDDQGVISYKKPKAKCEGLIHELILAGWKVDIE